MKKYRTTGLDIELREINRETAKYVYFKTKWTKGESRESKRAYYRNWHDSWEDAKQFLIETAKLKVRACQSGLDSAKARLKKVNDIKKPESHKGE